MVQYKNIKLASGVKIDMLTVYSDGKGLVRTSQKRQSKAKAQAAERYLRAEGFIS